MLISMDDINLLAIVREVIITYGAIVLLIGGVVSLLLSTKLAMRHGQRQAARPSVTPSTTQSV